MHIFYICLFYINILSSIINTYETVVNVLKIQGDGHLAFFIGPGGLCLLQSFNFSFFFKWNVISFLWWPPYENTYNLKTKILELFTLCAFKLFVCSIYKFNDDSLTWYQYFIWLLLLIFVENVMGWLRKISDFILKSQSLNFMVVLLLFVTFDSFLNCVKNNVLRSERKLRNPKR